MLLLTERERETQFGYTCWNYCINFEILIGHLEDNIFEIFDTIYLTAIGLPPDFSSTVHIYTQKNT